MDKRKSNRYRLNQAVRYVAVSETQGVISGIGTTVDFSGKGIRFRTDQTIPVGSTIELFVEWPVELNQQTPLQVQAKGVVVRNEGDLIAVQIKTHDFRTAKRKTGKKEPPAQEH